MIQQPDRFVHGAGFTRRLDDAGDQFWIEVFFRSVGGGDQVGDRAGSG